MNKRCIRCGKDETFRIIDEQYRLCADCYQDFVEFLQGSPVLKWNPVKLKTMTPEELAAKGFPEETETVTFAEGFLPSPSAEILISKENGSVYPDLVNGRFIYALTLNGDWEGVTAWAAMPEAYKPEEDGGGTNGD